MTSYIDAKRKLRSLITLEEFEDILKKVFLRDINKKILIGHYLQGKTFGEMALEYDFSERQIRRIHTDTIYKVMKYLE